MLYTISNNSNKLLINHLGFIEEMEYPKWKCKDAAYICFLKDYTRTDPSCRQWDINEKITNVKISENSISYSKKIESIKMNCTIKLLESGWDWIIKIQDAYPLHHRLGVTTPCGLGNIYNLEQPIETPISQYFRSFQEVYPDQTFIDIPILHCNTEFGLTSVFSSRSLDSQFFTYEDQNSKYIRLTVSTTLSSEITVSFRLCEQLSKIKDEYLLKYPSADTYLNKWKPIIEQIEKHQNIAITYHHQKGRLEGDQYEIIFQPTCKKDLDRFVKVLKLELDKYPPGLLNRIGVDGIMITGGLIYRNFNTDKVEYPGFYIANGSALVRSNHIKMNWVICAPPLNADVLHHEIFHIIEPNIDIERPNEKFADLFASLMIREAITPDMDKLINIIQLTYPEWDFHTIKYAEEDRYIWQHEPNNPPKKILFGDMPIVLPGTRFYYE